MDDWRVNGQAVLVHRSVARRWVSSEASPCVKISQDDKSVDRNPVTIDSFVQAEAYGSEWFKDATVEMLARSSLGDNVMRYNGDNLASINDTDTKTNAD